MSRNLPHHFSSGGTGTLATQPTRMTVHPPGAEGRGEVESFIAGVYRHRFGARVEQFATSLVSLREGGCIVAAAGYRDAGAEPLFLEHYLALPVEAVLAPHAARAPARTCIVEVGHLASVQAGQGWQLIARLGPHLAGLGYRWVVSTLTQELRRLLLRMGIAPLSLAPADPATLGEAARHWGSYYEHRPVVVAGHLPQALRHLQRRAARSA
ncbi:thermostable hemolysin [Ramlibacter sp. Leaf400]|uniref:thermostable hemolysin n=1 Tax=Ramlibacter sp. Leaf400 TaxID=1736365 RepID=UPI0006F5F77A|nr:thermostable hemolysin [Ramlibacter sp. Leaf400]KQT11066.1 hypothetical protein ASG30_08735 [Ramlibacter sp. Leaf400]